jgi:hypothetical protein
VIEQPEATGLADRSLRIRQFCAKRRIETLVHFTRAKNLRSILRDGLLSRKALSQLPESQRPLFNDHQRLDGHKEAICLSIEFPNDWMFQKYSSDDRTKWVVLCLNASVLWELDCAFCRENAASNAIKRISLSARKQVYALKQMFADYYYDVQRRDLQIADCYPTHPQAEVLVFDPISASCIKKVCFFSHEAKQDWLSIHPGTYLQTFQHSEEYFSFRPDRFQWRNSIHYQYTNNRRVSISMM